MKGRVLVCRFEEPLEQPDHARDRVKGEDDLLIVWGDTPQSKVGLLKVLLIKLVRFLKPYPRDTLDRLYLLRIVQAPAVNLRAVAKLESHIGLVDPGAQSPFGNVPLE